MDKLGTVCIENEYRDQGLLRIRKGFVLSRLENFKFADYKSSECTCQKNASVSNSSN